MGSINFLEDTVFELNATVFLFFNEYALRLKRRMRVYGKMLVIKDLMMSTILNSFENIPFKRDSE